jgi:hypothetical protein
VSPVPPPKIKKSFAQKTKNKKNKKEKSPLPPTLDKAALVWKN